MDVSHSLYRKSVSDEIVLRENVYPEGSNQYMTCQRSASNGNADAYVSCSVNVGTGTLDLKLIPLCQH